MDRLRDDGLSLETDALVEVAALVTDFDLNVLGDGVDLVVKPPAAALDQMNEVVTQMHTSSGLLEELDGGLTLREAEEQVLAYVREFVKEPRKAPLAGNTVGTDRAFLARDMPELEGWMHYRIIDVSSIKELTRQWYPRAYFAAPEQGGRPPRPGRHQREHRRAPLLPQGRVRAPARARHRGRPRTRHGGRRRTARRGRRRVLTSAHAALHSSSPCRAHARRAWWA